MNTKILTSSLILLLTGSGFSRTWTSADGAKTFEGDFVSSNANSVTVLKNGRKLTFKLEILSKEDQDFVAEAVKKAAAEEADNQAVADFKDSDLGKFLKKTQKFSGSRFKKHPIETVPEYFLLYYSASW